MAADAKLMEALLRIEHKLDLVMKLQMGGDASLALKKLGDVGHFCTLCDQAVNYDVDIQDAVVVRKCGCSTGKIALDLKSFAPPIMAKKTEKEDVTGTDQEDRRNPDRRGRTR